MSKNQNNIQSPKNNQIKNQTFSFNPIGNELITQQSLSNNNDPNKQKLDNQKMPLIKQSSNSSNQNKQSLIQQSYQTPKQNQLNLSQNSFYIPNNYKTTAETVPTLNTKNNSTQQAFNPQTSQSQQQQNLQQNQLSSSINFSRQQLNLQQSQKQVQNLSITNQVRHNNSQSASGIKIGIIQQNTLPSSPVKIGSMSSLQDSNYKKLNSVQASATKGGELSQNIGKRNNSTNSINFNVGSLSNTQKSFQASNQAGNRQLSINQSTIELQKDDILIKDSQYIKEKREQIYETLRNWSISDGESMAALLESNNLQLLISMFKCFQEELESKYILLPSTERSSLQRIVDIQRLFIKHIKDLVSVFQKNAKTIGGKDQYIQNLVQNLGVFQKTNEKFIQQINEYKLIDVEANQFIQKEKQFEQSAISLNFQNTKLQSQVDSLVKKIQEMESTIDIEALKKEIDSLKRLIEDQTQHFKEQTTLKDKQISVAQITAGSLKITNQKLEKEIAILRDAFQKHTIQINTLCAENEQLTEENNQFRERLYMLQEDIYGKNLRAQETKELLKKFQNAYKKLQEKVDRITLEKSLNIDPPDNPDFEEEVRFFETVRAVYKNNPLFTKRIKNEYAGLNIIEVDKKVKQNDEKPRVFQNQVSININSNEPNFNINHYRFYKFSFFTFCQHRYESIIKNNTQIYKFRKVTNLFMGQLRGILDSKWNEAVSIENYQSFSDFCDFTYSWLTTFCVDKLSRKIVLNQEYNEMDQTLKEVYIANFYVDLYNPILNKLWEVITFREFLSSNTSNDEIYFYLHCRNLIFKGPQLDYMESTFQPIHFIKFSHAKTIVEMVMCRYDQANIEFMIGTLFRKSTKKKGQYLIDSSLVLRLLLEYYRAERVQRFRLIKELFFSQQGYEINGQFAINFDSFCKIFNDNYKGTTNLEKAQLYRDCMTIGNGIVTSDIFYVVATERNFFMKNLRLKMLSELPEFDKNTLKFEPDFDFRSKMITKFFEDCKIKLKGCLKYLKDYSMNQGLEQNYMKVNELIGYVADLKNFNLDSTTIQGKNLPLYFSQLISKSIQVAEIQMYQTFQTGVNVGESEMMELLLNRFDNTMNFVTDYLETKRSRLEIKKLTKLKKFQVWIKKKISKWYGVLNVLLLAKLQEALKQERQQQLNNY
ncbi:hypothetical protein TTHERM_00688610 (macronuclear) [Tetrahymena thermophila SB210]|uniref:Uncharacterized protein n=1 Tax=Tetrahymena thermophila (strain SB210) TaxID=312017 RepID=I7MMT7_TETTS|nr:hypothetical protein TTHERM_00688610 [Tetrahymena thermophila SB210]EAS06721.2 hypothetical protein TTHERM_00688610 [Tetrahymena thermophila SB210]|eukprot:XP_001026963.2 hypothetical protein TTHERM_00688610 [Tetrahymena thermophila SB210]